MSIRIYPIFPYIWFNLYSKCNQSVTTIIRSCLKCFSRLADSNLNSLHAKLAEKPIFQIECSNWRRLQKLRLPAVGQLFVRIIFTSVMACALRFALDRVIKWTICHPPTNIWDSLCWTPKNLKYVCECMKVCFEIWLLIWFKFWIRD